MTRLFSINIFFHQQLFTALVSMRQQEEDYWCQVRYTDSNLQALLPGQQLMFHLSDVIKGTKPKGHNLTEELISCTNKAITDYLQLKRFD